MTQPPPRKRIRVAIAGGGIAGATLFYALRQHRHLDVHIFEAAPKFREAGASVGIHYNAFKALALISPDAVACLEAARAFKLDGFTASMAVGDDQGRTIAMVGEEGGRCEEHVVRSVSRAAMLRVLLADAPPQQMHTSKQLEGFETRPEGSLKLHFADTTTHECDILVGADGNTGWWNLFSIKPYREAQQLLDINDTWQRGWVGDGVASMYSIFDRGQAICHDWSPRLLKAIETFFCEESEQTALYLWEHAIPAPSYCAGPVCLLGDAAHATTPWLGSGGGMSIEDALILSTLLGRTKTSHEAIDALRIYDSTRRPRTQRVVKASHDQGVMWSGRGSETGLDATKLARDFSQGWDFIHYFDVEAHRNEALQMLNDSLRGQGQPSD
ncbi:hypothetical protein Daus18300_007401 [Diaporthe australafricana]|uniref:FAD-binding domain-containing protein n=1 Tax=Diaporthe australafricana TaxID=127596 RepID=A0ABR3WNG6_9PEZI